MADQDEDKVAWSECTAFGFAVSLTATARSPSFRPGASSNTATTSPSQQTPSSQRQCDTRSRRPRLRRPPSTRGSSRLNRLSPHHCSFGGTLSLARETLARFLEDIATSAVSEGFDVVLFVNGHRGNNPIVESAIGTVGATNPERAVVAGLTYFDLAASSIEEIRQTDTGGMSHAGEFETSLMLHCRPDPSTKTGTSPSIETSHTNAASTTCSTAVRSPDTARSRSTPTPAWWATQRRRAPTRGCALPTRRLGARRCPS